nr:alanine:cation symporter family protein [Polaromonas sp. CG_9.11]
MATKCTEVLLSMHFRKSDEYGERRGGPMFAIKYGLGKRRAWLCAVFTLFGGLAGFGIRDMVQSNTALPPCLPPVLPSRPGYRAWCRWCLPAPPFWVGPITLKNAGPTCSAAKSKCLTARSGRCL